MTSVKLWKAGIIVLRQAAEIISLVNIYHKCKNLHHQSHRNAMNISTEHAEY